MHTRRSFLRRTFAGALTAAGLAFGVPLPRWTWEEESATWGIDYWINGKRFTQDEIQLRPAWICSKVHDPYDWIVTE